MNKQYSILTKIELDDNDFVILIESFKNTIDEYLNENYSVWESLENNDDNITETIINKVLKDISQQIIINE